MFSSPVLVNSNEDFQNLRTLIVVVFALIVVPKYMASSCSTPPHGDHLILCTNQGNCLAQCHFVVALVVT